MADQAATDHQRAMQHQQQQHQQTRDSLSSSPSRHSSTNSVLENPDAQVLPPPNPNPVLHPRSVYLRDHVSIATVHPVMHTSQIPASLIAFLWTELNSEIERGNTYPLEEPLSLENFTSYWFGTFGAVMLLGGKEEQTDLLVERDWSTQCLGTFYVKPNYPGETTGLAINREVRNADSHSGRSSHICCAGFLTTFTARGKGCGKHLGEAYLDYAPKLVSKPRPLENKAYLSYRDIPTQYLISFTRLTSPPAKFGTAWDLKELERSKEPVVLVHLAT